MVIKLVLFQIAIFAVLIVILRVLFYKQLSFSAKRLQVIQEESLAKEAQLKREVEQSRTEYAAIIEKGEQEAKVIMEIAKKEGQSLIQRMVEETRLKNEKMMEEATHECRNMYDNFHSHMESISLNLAVEIFKHLYSDRGRGDLHRQFIAEVIDDIAKIEREKITVAKPVVKVVSSVALDESSAGRLKDILSRKLETDVTLDKNVDSQIVCGLIVSIGEFVIDGSLRNKLQKVVEQIKKQKGNFSDLAGA